MDWTDQIYTLTVEFPSEEKYGLVSRLRRSSISVVSNIAEGSSRESNKDFARFIEISYGSLMEVICQCMVAKKQVYITERQFNKIYDTAQELSRMLSGLKSYLLNKSRKSRDESGEFPDVVCQ